MMLVKKIKRMLKLMVQPYFLRLEVPKTYKKYAKSPVKNNKIVFIEIRFPEITDSFKLIYEKLKNSGEYEIVEHYLENATVSKLEYRKRVLAMLKDVSTAKYVFINDASTAVAAIPLRDETKLIQVWHACGAFKKFGLSTADLLFGENRRIQEKYPNYAHQSLVTVSSPEVVWAYEEAMGIQKNSGVVQPLGISRTDIFYDSVFIKKAYEKLYGVFPEAKGKKVILYAPTFRGRVAEAMSPDKLDVKAFYEKLGGEYVLLFKHHPFVKEPPVIPEEMKSFALDCTKLMEIDELLCVSDICISDYSSLVFEYSLFKKPIIFFAYDLEEYFDWRGFYYDYNELAPGLIAKTNEELLEYIQNIESRFDAQAVLDFKERFMSACDGRATERIIDYVFNELT